MNLNPEIIGHRAGVASRSSRFARERSTSGERVQAEERSPRRGGAFEARGSKGRVLDWPERCLEAPGVVSLEGESTKHWVRGSLGQITRGGRVG